MNRITCFLIVLLFSGLILTGQENLTYQKPDQEILELGDVINWFGDGESLLVNESHGYSARESILHVLWEQDQWLGKYVKNKQGL